MSAIFIECEDFTEVLEINKDKKQQVNENISADEVRVIDQDGNMVGILSLDEALKIANEANLDLVNVSPNANPPVCKVLDFGKYQYELQKKEKQSKKNQKQIQVKEVRLSVSIEEHDVEVKANTASKFLKSGDKVKVSIRFRGREREYVTKAYGVMNNFAALVSEFGDVDKKPKMEGRNMVMFLSPKKENNKK